MSDWEVKELVDCTSNGNISYGIVQPGKEDLNGVPILRVNNFIDGGLDVKSILKVSPEVHAKHQKTELEGGEVLLTLVGSTGQVAIVPNQLKGWNVARAIAVLKIKDEIGAKWINLWLQSDQAKHHLDSRANTTVQKTLNLKDVKSIPVSIPPVPERKTIEHIIYSLNDKIELNRQMNQTLEAMAQALFKSWFVDFDPVIDNALAVGNPIPEALQARAEKRKALLDRHSALDAESPQKGAPLFYSNPALAVLFPSSFEYNETLDKWIPEGWEVKGLGEIAHFGNGKTSPERFNDGIYPVYGSNGEIGRTNESNRENIIIIGRVGTYCGSLYYFSGKAWITDNAMFAQAKEISNNLFLFELLKRCNLNDMSTGSGQPLLNQGILKSIDTISPPDEILKHFNRQLSALEFKRTANVEQAETLTQLRDTLLPQLISGKVRVPASMLSGD